MRRSSTSAMEVFSKRWQLTAKKRPDAPASMVAAPEHRLDRMTAAVFGPLEMALELDQVPVGEFERGVLEKDDRMVAGGLGNVIHAFSHGLPIELDTPVQKIKWGKGWVEVEAGGRTFRAKEIILTVSAGVMKKLEFDPPLPEWKREAFDSLQMASFEKIALKFAPGTLDGVESFERGCGFDAEGRSTELLVKPWGKDVAVVMVGGDLAKWMLREPEHEAIDFAIDVMTQHYGDIFRAAFEHGERTEWTLDPYIGGTWAVSTPSSKDFDRTAYSKPVEDTIFIAGEACAGDWMTSVNGAFFNGREVGEKAFSIHAARAAI